MTAPIHVVIPVLNELPRTQSIVRQVLAEPVDRLWLFDNGSTDTTPDWVRWLSHQDDRLTLVERPDAGIYAMWNEGWGLALETTCGGPVAVAILNNDLTMWPQTLEFMRNTLYAVDERWAVYPDWRRSIADGYVTEPPTATEGTYQDGGMSGWCFMIRGEARLEGLPPIDEGYRWWYGDDDLAANITARGKLICRLDGLPLDHSGEGTAVHHPWVEDAKVADALRWRAKRRQRAEA